MVRNNKLHVRKMVLTAIFAALSVIVGFFEIPWPPVPFLKLDFSEVVILTSFLVIGLPRTVVVIIIRSLIRELILPKPFEPIPVIGEVMAILGSLVIVLLYKVIFTNKKVKRTEAKLIKIKKPDYSFFIFLKSSLIAVGFASFMTALNFFITLPIFLSGLKHFHFVSFINDPLMIEFTEGTLWGYTLFVVVGFLPFNLVKGVLTIILFDIVKVGLSEINFNEKKDYEIYKKTKRANC